MQPAIDRSHKPHKANVPYPQYTIQDRTLYISVLYNALLDMDKCIVIFV